MERSTEKYEVPDRHRVALGKTTLIVVGDEDMPHVLPLLTSDPGCHVPVFAVDPLIFTADQIIQSALFRGELPVWRQLRTRHELARRNLDCGGRAPAATPLSENRPNPIESGVALPAAPLSRFRPALQNNEETSERSLAVDPSILQRTFEQFRYARNLISAEETERWLGQRGLTLNDLGDFLRRQLHREAAGDGELELPNGQFPLATSDEDHVESPDSHRSNLTDYFAAPLELREALRKELLCSGEFDELAVRFAWRVAALDAVQRRNADGRSAASEGNRENWRPRPTDDSRWLEMLAKMEAAFRGECSRAVTPERRSQMFDALRLDLVSFEVELEEFESMDAAREAARKESTTLACGRTVAQAGSANADAHSRGVFSAPGGHDSPANNAAAVCSSGFSRFAGPDRLRAGLHTQRLVENEAHAPHGGRAWTGRLFAEDLPEDQRASFICALPGQILGPFPAGSRFQIFKLIEKCESTLTDSEVQRRIDQRIVEHHFSQLASHRVRWLLPLGNSNSSLPAPSIKSSHESDQREPFEDERGLFRKRRNRVRQIAFIRQIDAADCGAACLGMVCRHFGRKVNLSRIRQLCDTSTAGTSLQAICHAATELGLAARGLKVSRRNAPHLPLPAILHWDGNHWVVLLELGEKHARMADPATGIHRVTRAEFDRRWSGYAALFDYTAEFDKAPEAKTTLAWVWPFFKPFQSTLFEVLGLAGVVTVLQLLFPIFTQVIVDKVIVESDTGMLRLIILGLAVSGLFMLGSNLVQQYLLSFATVRIDSAILDYLTRRLLALPLSYFQRRRTGDIQRRLDGAQQIRSFVVRQGIGGILALVRLLGAVGLMMVYSLKLFGVFLMTAPLYFLLMIFSLKILRPIFADLEASHGRYSSHQIDAIKGIEAVKAASAEPAFRGAMLNEFLIVARKTFRSTFIGMSYESGIQLISLLSTALFLWVAAHMVIHGEITVGGFVAFNTLLAMAYAAVLRALGIWDELQMVAVLLDRLNDIFDHEPEQGRDRSRLRPIRSVEGRIELRNVKFRYGAPGSAEILQGLNLTIAPGQTAAIVGRSGSGKTTLAKLLAGLLEPTYGTIMLDGVDLKTINYRDLRRHIGLVLQDTHMFNGTIAENISFGDPEADADRVMKAAQLANAHDFIRDLPQNYETRIGESGALLSGGQKQRIAIARALYHDPRIFIFDEATSALDAESERALQSNLLPLWAGRTSIIIANRLSTIRHASVIVVLEKGQIVETGAHETLMNRRGLYYHLTTTSSQQLGI